MVPPSNDPSSTPSPSAPPALGDGASPSAENAPRKPIRIGSQRFIEPEWSGRKAPDSPTEGETPSPPASSAPATAAASPSPPAGTASPAVAHAVSAAPQATAPAVAAAPAQSEPVTEEDLPQVKTRPPKVDLPPPPPKLTPASVKRMTEELDAEVEAAMGGLSLDQMLTQGVAPGAASSDGQLEPESRQRAIVARIHRDDVFLQLPGRNQAVASLRTFSKPPKEGDPLEVVIRRFNVEDGLYEVLVPGAAMTAENWGDLAEGAVVEARITGSNTGGLECMVNNIRGFIPLSQVSLYRVENLGEFVNQKLLCVVSEANSERKNLVLSRRAVLEREKQEARQTLLEALEVGQVKEGVVRKLQDFGAFVDLGGVDGLLHVSQLSWDRVNHPSEVLTEGQKIQVKIQKIDRQTGKLSLSYRETLARPWDHAEQKYPVGAIVKGVVSRIMDFGAFVKLEPGIEGLVHISELAHHRVTRANSIVQVGQEIEVKVLSVDPENQRMSLSLKAVLAPPAPKETKEEIEARETEAAAAESSRPALPRSNKPLKGGLRGKSGGDKFGLNW